VVSGKKLNSEDRCTMLDDADVSCVHVCLVCEKLTCIEDGDYVLVIIIVVSD